MSPFKARALALRQDDDAFDALTDLFLGEVAGGKRTSARPTPPAKEPEPEGPRLRLAGLEDEDDEAAPAPIPDPATRTATAAPIAPPRRVLERVDADARPAAARSPVLECLVLGNLPVMASAWASQYVREVALAAGRPVASLRVQGDFAGVEIVGAGAADVPALPEGATLAEAIDAAAAVTDRWVVRCDAGDEPAVAARALTRVVTLLTGTDEMARHACGRTLRGLAPAFAGWEEAPVVRVAVMGAADDAARAAGEQIGAEAEAVLGTPVQRVTCTARISGSRPAVSLYSGPAEGGLAGVLDLVERALAPEGVGRPRHAASASPAAWAEPADDLALTREPEAAPRVAAVAEEAEPDLPAVEIEAVPVVVAAPVENMPAAPAVTVRPVPPPAPVAPERARPAASYDPVLGAIIGPGLDLDGVALPGGSPVGTHAPAARAPALMPWVGTEGDAAATEIKPAPAAEPGAGAGPLALFVDDLAACAVRCPYAAAVEIALDRAGGVHLLARAGTEEAEEAALQALLVAQSWAESHAALLAGAVAGTARAGGPGRVDASRRPVMHLFTARPKRSRRLLETPVRVHLLAAVSVEGKTGWCCVELN
jgi:hypothetical protein